VDDRLVNELLMSALTLPTLLVAHELKLFPLLAERPRTLEELCQELHVARRPLFRSRGRIVLLGDAVHATTPHLGQGAGMAIEDAIVLAEELAQATSPQEAFPRYQARRMERCRYIVNASRAIGDSQLGLVPPADQARVVREMFQAIAAPI
jgi:2-polyprenyl-6-methoxyphenol hydroxylase-like FAD-dependent oxidoreductase